MPWLVLMFNMLLFPPLNYKNLGKTLNYTSHKSLLINHEEWTKHTVLLNYYIQKLLKE